MKSDTNTATSHDRRPWAWIPTLYIAEGLPLVLVLTVSTILYTRLGVSATEIGWWTSILGFAWVIKPLWGPLVDLYWTKRRWAVLMQVLIGLLFIGAGLLLQGQWWWWGSLGVFGLAALFSATHDIAADGFYMDALDERQQSFFVGIRSTFYRIAMIFGTGFLMIVAGNLEMNTGPTPSYLTISAVPQGQASNAETVAGTGFVKFEPASIALDSGTTTAVSVSLTKAPDTTRTVTLSRQQSSWLGHFFPLGPDMHIDLAEKKYEVLKFSPENWHTPQQVVFKADAGLTKEVHAKFKAASGNLPLTWGICYGAVGVILLLFGLYHMFILPKPPGDGAHPRPVTPFSVALFTMALVVIIPVAIYVGLFEGVHKALVKTLAQFASDVAIPDAILTFITIALVIAFLVILFKLRPIQVASKKAFSSAARISQVPFDEIFASFFAKPGIARMLAFLLVYRLGESMLTKMTPIFLVKPVTEGGLGLTSAQFGIAYGTLGILSMLFGGILGGLVASRDGLKRWLWPMAFIIHVPDLLFVYLAYAQPAEFWKVILCICGENFGYGFGFTAYMIYMLYIAGQGEHKTSHFALCTGFMALGNMLPGMLSGALADALGWKHFFVLVCFATIPCFLVLPLIPLDPKFGRRTQTGEPVLAE